jgi:16S rRNA (guanine527-N7)-methyltransferase
MDIDSPEWARLIAEGAAALGLEPGPDRIALFVRHGQALLEWNAVTNLTTITRAEDVALSHFLDSLAAAAAVPAGSRVLDVGSGGGFPGLPLHVAVPGLQTTLLDASRKKVSFLRHVIRTLRLERIDAVHARVEELNRSPDHAQRYEVVVSRAFASMADLLRAVWPLIAPGGCVVALKGLLTDAELGELRVDAARGAYGAVSGLATEVYRLPGLKSERMRVVVRWKAG